MYKTTEISNHLSTWWYINTAHWSCIHFIFMNLLLLSPSFLFCSFSRITIIVFFWYDIFQWYKCCIIPLTNKLYESRSFTNPRSYSFILNKNVTDGHNNFQNITFPIRSLQCRYFSYNQFKLYSPACICTFWVCLKDLQQQNKTGPNIKEITLKIYSKKNQPHPSQFLLNHAFRM